MFLLSAPAETAHACCGCSARLLASAVTEHYGDWKCARLCQLPWVMRHIHNHPRTRAPTRRSRECCRLRPNAGWTEVTQIPKRWCVCITCLAKDWATPSRYASELAGRELGHLLASRKFSHVFAASRSPGVQAAEDQNGLGNSHDEDSNSDGLDTTSSAVDMLQVTPARSNPSELPSTEARPRRCPALGVNRSSLHRW
jgi:hypothetical protein